MVLLRCDKCSHKPCIEGDLKNLPEFCPMKKFSKVFSEAERLYLNEENLKVARAATKVALKAGLSWPRVREFIELARELKAERIGLAFCAGLSEEAAKLASILEEWGFKVYAVCCKCGSMRGEKLNLPSTIVLCNPIAQALLLNHAKTQLNAIVGLCIGHDAILVKLAKAPTVTLIAKDRVTGHNPAIALYTYYHRLMVAPSSMERENC